MLEAEFITPVFSPIIRWHLSLALIRVKNFDTLGSRYRIGGGYDLVKHGVTGSHF